MKNYITLFAFLFFVNILSAQTETNKELHSDGGAWKVYTVKEEGDKTILLIGNSICNGYKSHVAKELKDCRVVAWVNPYYLGEEYLDEDLTKVLKREKYDVIHFNIGLHGWPEGRIPEGQYQPLLQKYVDILKKYAPDSKIIWACITPVMSTEKPYVYHKELNPIIDGRNQIAKITMQNNKIAINDLYTLCSLNMGKARGDKWHWNGDMYRMIAIQTAGKIKIELAKKEQ